MKYLNENIQTLEALKKEYHRLCLKLHPDVGGSDEAMKILNAEYEERFERVKNIHVNKDGETYEKETDETPQEFQWMIHELLKLDGIDIEIIGCFIWVSGNTKPHKERLKELKFKWHSKRNVGTSRRIITIGGVVVNTVWTTFGGCTPVSGYIENRRISPQRLNNKKETICSHA